MSKIFILTLITSFNVMAAKICPLKDSSELFELVKKNHPQIAINNAHIESLSESVEVAKQRPNPEFDLESTIGESLGTKIYTTTASLMHTFEIGGKRDARIRVATKEIEYGKEVFKNQNEDALISSIKKFHRLRQVHELIPLYEEALETFVKIYRRFVNRRSLSPEQQVEKETLGLAISDYKLIISQLLSERINLNRHLSFFIGGDCEIPFEALPSKISFVKEFQEDSTASFSKLMAAKKMVELSVMKYEREKSLSMPDIQIGPVYQFEKESVTSTQTIGVSLSMDIPFLNTNSGGKAQALKRMRAFKIALKSAQMESEIDLKIWLTKYKNFSGSLKGIVSRKELKKKHHKIEALFKRGIISTSLVIESHRQLLSFYTTRFEFEIGAIEALWNIYKINGIMNDKSL